MKRLQPQIKFVFKEQEYSVNSLLLDRFKIVSLFGSGSFGAVFKGIDLANHSQEVIIKLVRPFDSF
jgi:serine/threonine protein kinase